MGSYILNYFTSNLVRLPEDNRHLYTLYSLLVSTLYWHNYCRRKNTPIFFLNRYEHTKTCVLRANYSEPYVFDDLKFLSDSVC